MQSTHISLEPLRKSNQRQLCSLTRELRLLLSVATSLSWFLLSSSCALSPWHTFPFHLHGLWPLCHHLQPYTQQTITSPYLYRPTSLTPLSTYFCIIFFGFDPITSCHKILNFCDNPLKATKFKQGLHFGEKQLLEIA